MSSPASSLTHRESVTGSADGVDAATAAVHASRDHIGRGTHVDPLNAPPPDVSSLHGTLSVDASRAVQGAASRSPDARRSPTAGANSSRAELSAASDRADSVRGMSTSLQSQGLERHAMGSSSSALLRAPATAAGGYRPPPPPPADASRLSLSNGSIASDGVDPPVARGAGPEASPPSPPHTPERQEAVAAEDPFDPPRHESESEIIPRSASSSTSSGSPKVIGSAAAHGSAHSPPAPAVATVRRSLGGSLGVESDRVSYVSDALERRGSNADGRRASLPSSSAAVLAGAMQLPQTNARSPTQERQGSPPSPAVSDTPVAAAAATATADTSAALSRSKGSRGSSREELDIESDIEEIDIQLEDPPLGTAGGNNVDPPVPAHHSSPPTPITSSLTFTEGEMSSVAAGQPLATHNVPSSVKDPAAVAVVAAGNAAELSAAPTDSATPSLLPDYSPLRSAAAGQPVPAAEETVESSAAAAAAATAAAATTRLSRAGSSSSSNNDGNAGSSGAQRSGHSGGSLPRGMSISSGTSRLSSERESAQGLLPSQQQQQQRNLFGDVDDAVPVSVVTADGRSVPPVKAQKFKDLLVMTESSDSDTPQPVGELPIAAVRASSGGGRQTPSEEAVAGSAEVAALASSLPLRVARGASHGSTGDVVSLDEVAGNAYAEGLDWTETVAVDAPEATRGSTVARRAAAASLPSPALAPSRGPLPSRGASPASSSSSASAEEDMQRLTKLIATAPARAADVPQGPNAQVRRRDSSGSGSSSDAEPTLQPRGVAPRGTAEDLRAAASEARMRTPERSSARRDASDEATEIVVVSAMSPEMVDVDVSKLTPAAKDAPADEKAQRAAAPSAQATPDTSSHGTKHTPRRSSPPQQPENILDALFAASADAASAAAPAAEGAAARLVPRDEAADSGSGPHVGSASGSEAKNPPGAVRADASATDASDPLLYSIQDDEAELTADAATNTSLPGRRPLPAAWRDASLHMSMASSAGRVTPPAPPLPLPRDPLARLHAPPPQSASAAAPAERGAERSSTDAHNPRRRGQGDLFTASSMTGAELDSSRLHTPVSEDALSVNFSRADGDPPAQNQRQPYTWRQQQPQPQPPQQSLPSSALLLASQPTDVAAVIEGLFLQQTARQLAAVAGMEEDARGAIVQEFRDSWWGIIVSEASAFGAMPSKTPPRRLAREPRAGEAAPSTRKSATSPVQTSARAARDGAVGSPRQQAPALVPHSAGQWKSPRSAYGFSFPYVAAAPGAATPPAEDGAAATAVTGFLGSPGRLGPSRRPQQTSPADDRQKETSLVPVEELHLMRVASISISANVSALCTDEILYRSYIEDQERESFYLLVRYHQCVCDALQPLHLYLLEKSARHALEAEYHRDERRIREYYSYAAVDEDVRVMQDAVRQRAVLIEMESRIRYDVIPVDEQRERSELQQTFQLGLAGLVRMAAATQRAVSAKLRERIDDLVYVEKREREGVRVREVRARATLYEAAVARWVPSTPSPPAKNAAESSIGSSPAVHSTPAHRAQAPRQSCSTLGEEGRPEGRGEREVPYDGNVSSSVEFDDAVSSVTDDAEAAAAAALPTVGYYMDSTGAVRTVLEGSPDRRAKRVECDDEQEEEEEEEAYDAAQHRARTAADRPEFFEWDPTHNTATSTSATGVGASGSAKDVGPHSSGSSPSAQVRSSAVVRSASTRSGGAETMLDASQTASGGHCESARVGRTSTTRRSPTTLVNARDAQTAVLQNALRCTEADAAARAERRHGQQSHAHNTSPSHGRQPSPVGRSAMAGRSPTRSPGRSRADGGGSPPVNRHAVPCSLRPFAHRSYQTLLEKYSPHKPEEESRAAEWSAIGVAARGGRPYDDSILFASALTPQQRARQQQQLQQLIEEDDTSDASEWSTQELDGSAAAAAIAAAPPQQMDTSPRSHCDGRPDPRREVFPPDVSLSESHAPQQPPQPQPKRAEEEAGEEVARLSSVRHASSGERQPPTYVEVITATPSPLRDITVSPSTTPGASPGTARRSGGARGASRHRSPSGARHPLGYRAPTATSLRQQQESALLRTLLHNRADTDVYPADVRCSLGRRRRLHAEQQRQRAASPILIARLPMDRGPGVWSAASQPRDPFGLGTTGTQSSPRHITVSAMAVDPRRLHQAQSGGRAQSRTPRTASSTRQHPLREGRRPQLQESTCHRVGATLHDSTDAEEDDGNAAAAAELAHLQQDFARAQHTGGVVYLPESMQDSFSVPLYALLPPAGSERQEADYCDGEITNMRRPYGGARQRATREAPFSTARAKGRAAPSSPALLADDTTPAVRSYAGALSRQPPRTVADTLAGAASSPQCGPPLRELMPPSPSMLYQRSGMGADEEMSRSQRAERSTGGAAWQGTNDYGGGPDSDSRRGRQRETTPYAHLRPPPPPSSSPRGARPFTYGSPFFKRCVNAFGAPSLSSDSASLRSASSASALDGARAPPNVRVTQRDGR